MERVGEGVPYAELHCHSNFSFLDGASHPDELVEEAARLDLEALAITDHDGMYGVVRFAEAAGSAGPGDCLRGRSHPGPHPGASRHGRPRRSSPGGAGPGPNRLRPSVQGALGRPSPGTGKGAPLSGPVPPGCHRRRCRTGFLHYLDVGGGRAALVARTPRAGTTDHWLVLTGCRKGAVPAALVRSGPAAARHRTGPPAALFRPGQRGGRDWDHGEPLASARNDALAELACQSGADVVATNNVHYHRPGRARLATAMAAVRGRRSLDDMDGWLPAAASAHLRSGAEQARRFARYPGAVERAAELGLACAFDLKLVAPRFPPFPTPTGHTEMTWLRHLTEEGARHRYGPRSGPPTPGLTPRSITNST